MQRLYTNLPKLKFNRFDENSLLKSESLFDTFPIYSINILTPSHDAHKEDFERSLKLDENVYFITKDISAAALIRKPFLDNFVRSGLFLATSHNARVEVENFLSIIHTGQMVLSLEQSISKSLALSKEKYNKKKRIKRTFETIIIDIKSPQFAPGRKIYDSIAFELEKIDHIKFTLLIKWRPSGNICPQSLKEYFHQQGIECTAYKAGQKSSSKLSIVTPKIEYDLDDEGTLQDIMEWIGAELCGIEYSNPDNEYASKFFLPQPSQTLNRLHNHSFLGFFSKEEVISLIKDIRKIFDTDPSLPFLVICLGGFQDSYVYDINFQCFSSADKFICIIAFPSSKFWVIALNAGF